MQPHSPAPVLALAFCTLAPATHRLPSHQPEPARQSVDLRPTLDSWGLTPRAQGARGTCSVFALTGAIEFAAAVDRGEGVRLSPEFLNWASNQAIGRPADGGFFSDLWKGYKSFGICAESDLPYQATFDPALAPGAAATTEALRLRDANLNIHWIKAWDVTTGLSPEELRAITGVLSQGWPVCAGLRWPIENAWNGDLLNTPDPEGVRDGHSILFVGFETDPNEPGGGVLTFRNSGGPTGDGRMTYEYASRYTNDAAWVSGRRDAPLPATDKPDAPADQAAH
ncbi:MAG: C1 family peptidase [Phycisphaerales bacterium]|nr:C1 family peptidase [Phycisphaerales bacterium]